MSTKIKMWQKAQVIETELTRKVPEMIGKVIWALPPTLESAGAAKDPVTDESFTVPEGMYCLTNLLNADGFAVYMFANCLEFIRGESEDDEWLKEHVDYLSIKEFLNP